MRRTRRGRGLRRVSGDPEPRRFLAAGASSGGSTTSFRRGPAAGPSEAGFAVSGRRWPRSSASSLACTLWTGVASPGLKLLPGLDGLADESISISLQSAVLGIDDGSNRPGGGAGPRRRGRARARLRREPALAHRPPRSAPRRGRAAPRRPAVVSLDDARRRRARSPRRRPMLGPRPRAPVRQRVAARPSPAATPSAEPPSTALRRPSAPPAAPAGSDPSRSRLVTETPRRRAERADGRVHLGCARARDRRRDVRRLGRAPAPDCR